MKTERAIRRLFADNGFEIISVRSGKHWIVLASKEERVGRFVLARSPSDHRVKRKIEADMRRGGNSLAAFRALANSLASLATFFLISPAPGRGAAISRRALAMYSRHAASARS
jgi:hypothetical protein